jgi:hypothetical protein
VVAILKVVGEPPRNSDRATPPTAKRGAKRGPTTSLNKLIGEGKRFRAYDIVRNLERAGQRVLLQILRNAVVAREKIQGKMHQVFEPYF